MSQHEKLVKNISQLPVKGRAVRHVLRIVSDLHSNREVDIVERVVHFGHQGEIPDIQNIAVKNLAVAGRTVDTYVSSKIVDLQDLRSDGLVGQYHKGEDTFAYTEIIEEKGRERVETVAFTSKSKQEVRDTFGEPEKPVANNIIIFHQREELRPTG